MVRAVLLTIEMPLDKVVNAPFMQVSQGRASGVPTSSWHLQREAEPVSRPL